MHYVTGIFEQRCVIARGVGVRNHMSETRNRAAVIAVCGARRFRAHCPGFHPCFGERARFLLGAGSRLAAKAGRPSPANQSVGADVMHERFQ